MVPAENLRWKSTCIAETKYQGNVAHLGEITVDF